MNLNDTPSTGPLTAADFARHPAEAATDIGAEPQLHSDGQDRWLGARITLACALLSVICAGLGFWLKT